MCSIGWEILLKWYHESDPVAKLVLWNNFHDHIDICSSCNRYEKEESDGQ